MAKRRTTQAEARAEKKRAKLASYAQEKSKRKPSKCRQRINARRNGQPMADRSGERKPWWEQGPGLPLSVEMAHFAARVRRLENESPRMAKAVAAGVGVLESAA